jgi:hypothetical protein
LISARISKPMAHVCQIEPGVLAVDDPLEVRHVLGSAGDGHVKRSGPRPSRCGPPDEARAQASAVEPSRRPPSPPPAAHSPPGPPVGSSWASLTNTCCASTRPLPVGSVDRIGRVATARRDRASSALRIRHRGSGARRSTARRAPARPSANDRRTLAVPRDREHSRHQALARRPRLLLAGIARAPGCRSSRTRPASPSATRP